MSTENVSNSINVYEKYIISMNDNFQRENKELRNQIIELEKEKSELVEENDKYDTSKRYTKGLLKNLVELENLHLKVSKNNESEYKKLVENFERRKKLSENYVSIYNAIICVILFLVYKFDGLNFIIQSQCVVEMLSCLLTYHIFSFNYFFRKLNSNIPNNIYIPENIELEAKIKKIKDSQDFLSEYIDNI